MKRALKLLSSGNPSAFRRGLLSWYDKHQRALPWRNENDGYRIWVSEIMLQQTRVAVVKQRYGTFLRCFPDVRSLARAPLSRVLAEWSGLGYYRRAHHLHQAARHIVAQYGGEFPCDAATLASPPLAAGSLIAPASRIIRLEIIGSVCFSTSTTLIPFGRVNCSIFGKT